MQKIIRRKSEIMKKSLWLKKYEEETKAKRTQSMNGKNKILLIVPVMFMIIFIAAVAGGGLSTPEAKNGMIGMALLFVVIILFVIIIISRAKKKDVTKHTAESVNSLFETDEDVEQFDRQMQNSPIMQIKTDVNESIFLTMDYVGKSSQYGGDLSYTFIKRTDITSLNYCKMASTTANPLKASYAYDIRNAQNRVIMNGIASSMQVFQQIEELIKTARPSVTVNKK